MVTSFRAALQEILKRPESCPDRYVRHAPMTISGTCSSRESRASREPAPRSSRFGGWLHPPWRGPSRPELPGWGRAPKTWGRSHARARSWSSVPFAAPRDRWMRAGRCKPRGTPPKTRLLGLSLIMREGHPASYGRVRAFSAQERESRAGAAAVKNTRELDRPVHRDFASSASAREKLGLQPTDSKESWSGRRDSNPRRPAWENAPTSCIERHRVS